MIDALLRASLSVLAAAALRRIRPWAQGFAAGPGFYAFMPIILVSPVIPMIVLFRAPRLVREAQLAVSPAQFGWPGRQDQAGPLLGSSQ